MLFENGITLSETATAFDLTFFRRRQRPSEAAGKFFQNLVPGRKIFS